MQGHFDINLLLDKATTVIIFQDGKQTQEKPENMEKNDKSRFCFFLNWERGKFYHSDAKLNTPIDLDDEVMPFVERIAQQKGTDHCEIKSKRCRSVRSIYARHF